MRENNKVALFAAFFVFSALLACKTAPKKKLDPPLEVTAEELRADYKASEAQANAKYKGKWLLVSGTVESVGKLGTGSPTLNLKGKDGNVTLLGLGRLTEDLKPGNQVWFECKFKELLFGTHPMLDECLSTEASSAKWQAAVNAAKK